MRKAVKRKVSAGTEEPAQESGIRLTTPDLVILSLLAERPMHGYEVNATLEDRNIRDWAAVSRPQIYYSLEKLTRLKLIRITEEAAPAAGPERRVLETTEAGRERLADALEAKHWVDTQTHPPFLTWLALSWQARPRAFQRQLKARAQFLSKRLAEEKETLRDVLDEVGHPYHEAVWMLQLTIKKIEIEREWLAQIAKESSRRAPARSSPRR
jgi:DNA-binding PadR family transcriptional regulator